MFVKLVVLSFYLALVTAAYNGPLAGGAPAAQFPAGVDPQACPNYPICQSAGISIGSPQPAAYSALPGQISAYPQYTQQISPGPQYTSVPQFNPVAQYNAPSQYQSPSQKAQYSPAEQNALNKGEYIGDGDYHGEGLAESGATEYSAPQSSPAFNGVPYQGIQAETAYSHFPSQLQGQAVAPSAYSHLQRQFQGQAVAPSAYSQYQGQSAESIVPAGVGHPAQFPAGLDPRACPNYPFCT